MSLNKPGTKIKLVPIPALKTNQGDEECVSVIDPSKFQCRFADNLGCGLMQYLGHPKTPHFQNDVLKTSSMAEREALRDVWQVLDGSKTIALPNRRQVKLRTECSESTQPQGLKQSPLTAMAKDYTKSRLLNGVSFVVFCNIRCKYQEATNQKISDSFRTTFRKLDQDITRDPLCNNYRHVWNGEVQYHRHGRHMEHS